MQATDRSPLAATSITAEPESTRVNITGARTRLIDYLLDARRQMMSTSPHTATIDPVTIQNRLSGDP